MDHSVLQQALQALSASDERIMELLTLRHQLASRLARTPSTQGTPDCLEARVAAVVSRLARHNPGPLETRHLAAIFETVIRLTEPLCAGLSRGNGALKKG